MLSILFVLPSPMVWQISQWCVSKVCLHPSDLSSGSNATPEWIRKKNQFGAYKSCCFVGFYLIVFSYCSVCNKDNLPYDIKSAWWQNKSMTFWHFWFLAFVKLALFILWLKRGEEEETKPFSMGLAFLACQVPFALYNFIKLLAENVTSEWCY